MYTKAMTYSLYRLDNSKSGGTPLETGNVRDYTKRMELPLKKDHFATRPIQVFLFLKRFVKYVIIQEMSGSQD